jgi:hypothetical protein
MAMKVVKSPEKFYCGLAADWGHRGRTTVPLAEGLCTPGPPDVVG